MRVRQRRFSMRHWRLGIARQRVESKKLMSSWHTSPVKKDKVVTGNLGGHDAVVPELRGERPGSGQRQLVLACLAGVIFCA